MSTTYRTAGAAGSIALSIKNSGGQLITPVSTPTVAWYTDAARTTGLLALSVTGSGSSYTAAWTGPQAPAVAASRYLKVTIETATGVFSVDVDDDIGFLTAGAVIGTTDYTTLAAVKSDLGITDTTDDVAIGTAITAASRAIDQWTETTFYPVTETRTFATRDPYKVWVDRFTSPGGLVVATGTTGSYATTIADTDRILWPYNAPAKRRAYERIESPGGLFSVENRPTVQVTATWGWHYLPEDGERAARIKAARLFRRKDSPEGIAGTSEFGVVRISKFEDPDVAMLLMPYQQSWIR